MTRILDKAKPVLFILLVVAVFVKLFASSVFANKGDELAQLEEEAAEVTRQNNLLRQELALQSSLIEISSQAEELGFVKPENFLYINPTESVAFLTSGP